MANLLTSRAHMVGGRGVVVHWASTRLHRRPSLPEGLTPPNSTAWHSVDLNHMSSISRGISLQNLGEIGLDTPELSLF